MERYGIEFGNVQETKYFNRPCQAGTMRNSSPSKSLKMEIMDGAFFRGLGKSIPSISRPGEHPLGECRIFAFMNAARLLGLVQRDPKIKGSRQAY
jgi:hypothetical protein